jgi:hypothetical protein
MRALKQMESGADVTILVVTAQPGHKKRALDAGAKDFVSKPFETVEVLTRIHNLLEAALLRRQTSRHDDETNGPIMVLPDEEIRHLAAGFLQKCRDHRTILCDALAGNDLAMIQRLGERLTGTGLTYGFDGISDIGRALEHAAKASNVEDVDRAITLLSSYLQRVDLTGLPELMESKI